MTHPPEADPLRPMLAETERELGHRLEEACAAQDISTESTAELMRLEESLLDAAKVAKQAVSLRRRLRSLDAEAPSDPGEAAPPPRRATVHHPAFFHERFLDEGQAHDTNHDTHAAAAAAGDITVRELRDVRGVEWRVWEVIPQISGSKGSPGDRLGDYGQGWLAFESSSGNERRRLPHFPDGWKDLDDSELEKLLDRADVVQVRRKGSSPELPSSS